MSDAGRALDTSADADAVQIGAYRRLGGAQRVSIMFGLNALTKSTAIAGIRRRHPEYDDRRVQLALCHLLWGETIVRQARPDLELVDP